MDSEETKHLNMYEKADPLTQETENCQRKDSWMEIERIYKYFGRPGLYQGIVVSLLCLNYIPIVNNHLAMVFYGLKGNYECFSNSSVNSSSDDLCDHQDTCDQIIWEETPKFSLVSEFELICDKSHLVTMSTTVYFVGVMVGGLIFGMLSDLLGRKKVMIMTMFASGALGIGIALSWSFTAFIVMRFFQGALIQGLQTSSYIMIMEAVPMSLRAAAGASAEVVWGLGVMWLSCISWLLYQWRKIQLALAIPQLVLIIPYIIVVPESLRWLILHGRWPLARAWVNRAGKINRLSLEAVTEVDLCMEILEKSSNEMVTVIKNTKTAQAEGTVHDSMQKTINSQDQKSQYTNAAECCQESQQAVGQASKPKKKTALSLLCKSGLPLRLFVLSFIWLSVAFGYYGISFALRSFGGNIYLSVLIGGVLEIIAYISSIFTMGRFGRRRSLASYLFFGALFCLAAAFCPKDFNPVIRSTMAVLGRFGFAGTFCIIFVYTSEVFPTSIRNVALGICVSFTRVGAMIAPQVLLMDFWSVASIPLLFYGAVAAVAGSMACLLPETLNKPLPDSVDQAAQLDRTLKSQETTEL